MVFQQMCLQVNCVLWSFENPEKLLNQELKGCEFSLWLPCGIRPAAIHR